MDQQPETFADILQQELDDVFACRKSNVDVSLVEGAIGCLRAGDKLYSNIRTAIEMIRSGEAFGPVTDLAQLYEAEAYGIRRVHSDPACLNYASALERVAKDLRLAVERMSGKGS